jgi:hypothetical protein
MVKPDESILETRALHRILEEFDASESAKIGSPDPAKFSAAFQLDVGTITLVIGKRCGNLCVEAIGAIIIQYWIT